MNALYAKLDEYFAVINASEEDIFRIVAALAEDTHERIIADTPVKTGRARAGWELNNKTRPGVIEFEFRNDVPYIVWLEYGHSDQAPRGMLRINLQKAKKRINDRLRGYLRRRGL